MVVEAQVTINSSRAAIWRAISEIENAPTMIKGIVALEVLERPASGLVGLKWRETRLLFGKPASVDKWITEATDGQCYSTRAEDGGFVFVSTMRLLGQGDGVTLSSRHESRPQGLLATLQAIPMRLFFKGVVRKALLQDLHDIKAGVERTPPGAPLV